MQLVMFAPPGARAAARRQPAADPGGHNPRFTIHLRPDVGQLVCRLIAADLRLRGRLPREQALIDARAAIGRCCGHEAPAGRGDAAQYVAAVRSYAKGMGL